MLADTDMDIEETRTRAGSPPSAGRFQTDGGSLQRPPEHSGRAAAQGGRTVELTGARQNYITARRAGTSAVVRRRSKVREHAGVPRRPDAEDDGGTWGEFRGLPRSRGTSVGNSDALRGNHAGDAIFHVLFLFC